MRGRGGRTLARLAASVWPAAGLATVLFVAANLLILALPAGWRIDLTEEKRYTLAPATRAVLATLDEPIDLTLYRSADLVRDQPALGPFVDRVGELIGEYVVAAGGMIRLSVVDPAPFSPAEDRALAAGLVAVPRAGGDSAYLGLVAHNSVDDRAVVPLFRPQEAGALEYDLTALVAALAVPERPRVGVLGRLELFGPDGGPWLIVQRLAEFFDIAPIAPDTGTIDPAIDVLLLVQPRGLAPATLYAVDQFLLDGGRAIVFVDPYSEVERRHRPAAERFAPNNSDLGPFAAAWGVALAPGAVAADPSRAVPLVQDGPQGARADNIVWLSLGRDGMAEADAITSALDRVNLATAGSLTAVPVDGPAAPRLTPLIRTTAEGGTVPVDAIRAETDVRTLPDRFGAAEAPVTLAARLTGPAVSAFPDGPPDGAAGAAAHLAASRTDLDIVVVADTDLLADTLWAAVAEVDGQPTATAFANNDAFLVNAVEALRGAVNLAPLRGRAETPRPLERLAALSQRIDAETRAAEARLLTELATAEEALAAQLAADSAASADPASAEAAALADLRRRLVDIRRELRGVQHALRREGEDLAFWVRFGHVVGLPAAVLLLALAGGAVLRRWRAGAP